MRPSDKPGPVQFDARTQAFIAFDGVPRRGVYDNLKTVVDRVGRGKDRQINARFESLHGHYLLEPDDDVH